MDALAEFRGRAAGTDAERRAAVHLAERLRQMGRQAVVEPISIHPNWAVTHVIHAVLAIVGSVIAVRTPVLGAAILLATAVSTYADLTGSFLLVRRLTGRRASQNVLSREDGGKRGTIVLVAGYDSLRRAGRLARLASRRIGAFQPFFWSMVLILACSIVRLFGVEALPLTIVQFIPTVVLILYVPLLADVALSGVDDAAPGVDDALELARAHGGRLEHFDLWVLLTGAGGGLMLGMREFLRAHRHELDPGSTIFLGLGGREGHATKEGFVLASAYHPTLLELAAETGSAPYVSRGASDAHLARLRGYPALPVSDAGALVELVDRRVGPDLDRVERPAD